MKPHYVPNKFKDIKGFFDFMEYIEYNTPEWFNLCLLLILMLFSIIIFAITL